MKNANKGKEVPTKENEVFNHEAEGQEESIGVSENELTTLIDRLNEEVVKDPNVVKFSQLIEGLMQRCTKKELAIMFQKQAEAASMLTQILESQEEQRPNSMSVIQMGKGGMA